jgi:hypothetical protein
MWLKPPRQFFTNFAIEFDEYMDNSVDEDGTKDNEHVE